ncbi:GIN domain-containing protein [Sphingomonas aracearum]|uniref:DUF2807 domain-containing protein n=1 Tax=Sphingomonas aracearum TaxID=2283317 RepID=A0A369VQQ3_9SPHN|nr:DUF2807 domain-containing protein [Sphingomonas aracearum]RDE04714.1 DUF2807 domain-containing protein [Sphingomonas aracearum]
MNRLLALLALLLPAPALAAERGFTVTSFDRVRIDGPFEVRLASGRSPAARATGDAEMLDRLSVTVDGTTLTVRLGGQGWGERPRAATTQPIVLTLGTPTLRAVQANGGGRVAIAGMKGQRVDLTLSGTGALAADGIAADQLDASVIGSGSLRLAGRAARTRLLSNGSGTIEAGTLAANDLVVRLDGTGAVSAAARYTAAITSTGLGSVAVAGNPACTVNREAAGPIACGSKQP